MSNKKPLVCHLGMAGINFKHSRIDICYRSTVGTKKRHTSIVEAINDPELSSQRLQLLNGEWPIACYDCQFMEEAGAESYRKKVKLDYHKPDSYFTDNVNPETGEITELRRIEFRFNNVCNYACRHCSPEYSSYWEKIVKKNQDLAIFDDMKSPTIEPSYANALENFDEISHFIKDNNLELEITGGEPFFQTSFYECLEKLQPFANKIDFIVTTNGSIAGKFKDYDVIKLLKTFNEVYLKVSLDGSRSFYNYFRQGGDWDTVVKNIKAFEELPNVRIAPIVTISNMQAARMPEIYKDYFEITADPKRFNSGEVVHPDYTNPSHFPEPLKQKYLKECEEFRETLSDPKHFDRISDFAIRMLKKEGSEEAWKTFCSFTDKLDKIHNKRAFDYFPEWEEFWHKS